MHRSQLETGLRTLVVAVVVMLTSCPIFGQGTPAGNGMIPRIDLAHYGVGTPNQIVIGDFPVGASAAVVFSHATEPTTLPGYGPAVLVPDPVTPLGAITLPYVVGPTGRLAFNFTIPVVHTHTPWHLQAAAVDFAAPFGGVTVSDYRGFTFGSERQSLPIALANGDGTWRVREIFPYGIPAAPQDPRLAAVVWTNVELTNSDELAWGRSDVPVLDLLDDVSARVRLPDGSSLMMVRTPNFATGLVRLGADGSVRTLAWAQGQGAPAFETEIGVSPFDPYAAIVGDDPLPEYGSASLVLIRTDGRNVPGTADRATGIPLPAGYEVDETSLCFLDGALFFGDGESDLRRLDLATRTVSVVTFPGSMTGYVDESCAPAADGSCLALGAGASELAHDVWTVTASGLATNVTQLPGEYEDPARTDPTGMQMAMDATGQRVAYMRPVAGTNEAFVTEIGQPERHVTNGAQFIDSIDTVAGVGFLVGPSLHFVAGQGATNVDLYRADATLGVNGPITTIDNVTQSSGMTAPVFDLGANLELTRRFTAGGMLFSCYRSGGTPDRLQVTDAMGATISFSLGNVERVLPRVGGAIVVDRTATGEVCVRSIGPGPAVTDSWQSAPGHVVVAATRAPETSECAIFVDGPSGCRLVKVAANGSMADVAGPAGTITGSMAMDASGRTSCATSGATGVSIMRHDPATGAWTALVTQPDAVRFLR